MYAVIVTGGKQYRVVVDQTVRIEKLVAEVGNKVEFPVLMVADGDQISMGAPYISGRHVVAEVVAHGRGEKIKIIKFRRRKHSRKQMGHRQDFTEVKITKI